MIKPFVCGALLFLVMCNLNEQQFHENLQISEAISDLVSQIEDADIKRQDKLDAIDSAIKMLTDLKFQL